VRTRLLSLLVMVNDVLTPLPLPLLDDSTPAGEYDPVPGTLPTFLSNLGATAKAVATVSAAPSTGSSSTTGGGGSAGFSTASVGSVGVAFAAILSSAFALLA
jgi:hypothetical protein